MSNNFKIPGEIELSFPVETDADGYYDKECPSENCLSKFKVHQDDWKALDEESTIHCPFCRHEAGPRSWWTTEQLEQAKQMALEQAKHIFSGHLDKMLGGMASDFNRRQRSGSFITMKMDYRGFNAPEPVMVPLAAVDVMQSKITCGSCGFRFGFIGTAYFCPKCGHHDIEAIFAAHLRKMRKMPETIEALQVALGRDEAANLANTLMEEAIKGGVTQFETIARHYYVLVTGALPSREKGNLFQRLPDASAEWRSATGKAFEDIIGKDDLGRLNVYFQRRHVLGHNDGHVDEKYVATSGDTSYQPAQRIVVKVGDVLDFADILERLVNGLRESLP
ncbi:MAG: hypothetical protein Q8O35_01280 [Humidesulfovibrio sp.]|uniref:hypothetical protein n=1 Tax=Humidesulfovibrio sp. TaxID=2910988 RepID=UPI0027337D99|nr:hypothetical protein [Humidesulfovibrio sp.]MDP2846804.1 hypothetical protein [Humidesulfovibrio sp.]